MEITLKNGEHLTLDWNPLILEYLEEYEGGIYQLKEDVENIECRFYAFNHILYSVINANYHEELTYRQAVSLVSVNDIEKIVDFIVKNVSEINTGKNENRVVSTKKQHRR